MYVYVKDVALQKLREAGVKGRSGHWNHAGIPGHKGGSLPGLSAQGSDFVIKVSGRLTPWEFSKEGVDGMVISVKNTLSEMGEDWSKELRLVLIEDTEDMTGRSGSYLGVGQYMDGAIIIHPTNVMKAFSRQLPIKEAFRRVFTHELAHHYFSQHESEFSSFSSTPFSLLWVGIHAKALDGGKSPTVHSLDNPSEYFSAAFEQYVLNQRGTIEVEAWDWFDKNVGRKKFMSESVLEFGTPKSGHWGHSSVAGRRGGSAPGKGAPKDPDKPPEMKAPRFGPEAERVLGSVKRMAGVTLSKDAFRAIQVAVETVLDAVPDNFLRGLNGVEARAGAERWAFYDSKGKRNVIVIYPEHFKETHAVVNLAGFPPERPTTYKDLHIIVAHELGHHISDNILTPYEVEMFDNWRKQTGEALRKQTGGFTPDKPVSTGDWRIARQYGLDWGEFFTVNFEAYAAGRYKFISPPVLEWFDNNIKRFQKRVESVDEVGTAKSGHWRHAGIPGHKGGSLPGIPGHKGGSLPGTAKDVVGIEKNASYTALLASGVITKEEDEVVLSKIRGYLDKIPAEWAEKVDIVLNDQDARSPLNLGLYVQNSTDPKLNRPGGSAIVYVGSVKMAYEDPTTPSIYMGIQDWRELVGVVAAHEIGHAIWYDHLNQGQKDFFIQEWEMAESGIGKPPPRSYGLKNYREFFSVNFEAWISGHDSMMNPRIVYWFNEEVGRRLKKESYHGKYVVTEYGVKGRSGHWKHQSQPGHRGGSLPKDGQLSLALDTPAPQMKAPTFGPEAARLLSKIALEFGEIPGMGLPSFAPPRDVLDVTLNSIKDILAQIPDGYLVGLEGIYITNAANAGYYGCGFYSGATGAKRITITPENFGRDLTGKGFVGFTSDRPITPADTHLIVGHEIAHHVWYEHLTTDELNINRKAWNKVKEDDRLGVTPPNPDYRVARPYALQSESEFFAVAFEAYAAGRFEYVSKPLLTFFDKKFKRPTKRIESVLEFGTTKSGHWGHKGIPKHKGGSLPKGDGGGNLNPALVTGSSDYIAKGRSFSDDVETISESAGKLPKEWFNGIVGVVLHTAPELKGGKYGTYAGWYDEVGTRVIGKPQDAVIHLNVDAFTGPANTFLHEMGHHFLHNFAKSEDFDKLDEFFVAAEREQIPYPRLYAMSSPSEFFCESLEFFLRGDVEGTVAPVVQDFIKGVLSRSYKKESIDEASKFLSVASLNPIRRAFTSIQSVLSGNVLNRSSMYGQSVEMINKAMGNYQSAIDNLVGDLESGRLSPEEALSRFKVTAENSYRVAYLAGGYRAGNPFYRDLGITPEDTSQVGGAMNFESGFWQDFQRDIKDKSYPRERVETRAKMYGDAIYSQYWNGYTAGLPDTTELAWIMGDAEHCEDCENMAANSPYTKASLPTVPRAGDTRCLSNCKCRILELVNEDILTNKMLPPKVGMSRSELYGMNPVEVLMSNGEAASPDVTTMLAGIYAEINRLRQLIEIDQGNLQMYVLARKRAVEQAIGLAQVYNVTVIPKYAVSELVGAVQGMISHGWELARSGGAFQVGQMVREVRSVFINAGLVTSVTGDIIRVMTPRGELVVNVPESLVFVQGA